MPLWQRIQYGVAVPHDHLEQLEEWRESTAAAIKNGQPEQVLVESRVSPLDQQGNRGVTKSS